MTESNVRGFKYLPVVFLGISIQMLILRDPWSEQIPAKFNFEQLVNHTASTNQIRIWGKHDPKEALVHINNVTCSQFKFRNFTMNECYFSGPPLNPLISTIPRVEFESFTSISISADESKDCSVQFSRPLNITSITGAGESAINETERVRLLRRHRANPWKLVLHDINAIPMPFSVSCFYDDWTVVSSFPVVSSLMPPWAILTKRMMGLAELSMYIDKNE